MLLCSGPVQQRAGRGLCAGAQMQTPGARHEHAPSCRHRRRGHRCCCYTPLLLHRSASLRQVPARLPVHARLLRAHLAAALIKREHRLALGAAAGGARSAPSAVQVGAAGAAAGLLDGPVLWAGAEACSGAGRGPRSHRWPLGQHPPLSRCEGRARCRPPIAPSTMQKRNQAAGSVGWTRCGYFMHRQEQCVPIRGAPAPNPPCVSARSATAAARAATRIKPAS